MNGKELIDSYYAFRLLCRYVTTLDNDEICQCISAEDCIEAEGCADCIRREFLRRVQE